MNAAIDSLPVQADALARARAFAEPLLANAHLDTAENMLDHADAVAAILRGIGGSDRHRRSHYHLRDGCCPCRSEPGRSQSTDRGAGRGHPQ
jgi:hypothetical protein